MVYLYLRVSTGRQDENRQMIALENINYDRKFIDRISGIKADRPELDLLKSIVKEGDIIYIDSVSRLGRNVDNLRELVDYFVSKKVVIHFIKEGFNTTGEAYQFLLTTLGAIAEIERETTRQRIIEGIEKAKRSGTKSGKPFGRIKMKKEDLPPRFFKLYKKWKDKKINITEFSQLYGKTRNTVYHHIKLYEE